MVGPGRIRQHVGQDPAKDHVQARASFRRRAAEQGPHLRWAGAVQHRIGIRVRQPGSQRIHGRIAGAPHRLHIHGQRMVHRVSPHGRSPSGGWNPLRMAQPPSIGAREPDRHPNR